MSSLRRSLNWLFVVLVLVGTFLLVSGLYLQWQQIKQAHQLRQHSQVLLISNAMHSLLVSQETLLALPGRQALFHWRLDQLEAIDAILQQILDINANAAAYALLDVEGNPIAWRWRPLAADLDGLTPTLIEYSGCDGAVGSDGAMAIGRPLRIDALNRWLLPVCQALEDETQQIGGFIAAALLLEGPNSFIENQAILGPTNIVQVIREAGLQPILWGTSLDIPPDYLAEPIPLSFYEQAIESAERLSGQSIDQLRASGQPARFQFINSAGQQLGTAIHDSRYRFWVLSQTSRSELIEQLKGFGWTYGASYLAVLLAFLVMIVAINRAERRRRQELVYQAGHDMLTGLPNRQSMRGCSKFCVNVIPITG
ncbi:MAG: hypothetical protein CVV18_03915 [Gammaproteobacteria bacterium HGW-Gammaproteobacteria-8]|nr:MAG: hypothetical protein CVV18_03915 [Gammaproteobacteria bacterium HGW-Gammaproteobacteria-8]